MLVHPVPQPRSSPRAGGGGRSAMSTSISARYSAHFGSVKGLPSAWRQPSSPSRRKYSLSPRFGSVVSERNPRLLIQPLAALLPVAVGLKLDRDDAHLERTVGYSHRLA